MMSVGGRMIWQLNYQLREWQEEALDIWVKSQAGIVAVVTGGGKTVFAEACMTKFRERFPAGKVLILVPTQALTDQWFVSLQEELGVSPNEIETVGGGGRYSGKKPVTIAIINSARRLAGKWASEAETLLIVDECHRAGSPENAKALKGNFAARLGLSATPEREYDEGFLNHIEPALGPIIFRYSYREAFRDGVIVPFNLTNVQVDFLSDERAEYDKLSKRIAVASRRAVSDSEHLKRLLIMRASVSANASMRIPVAVRLAETHRGERTVIFHERIEASSKILQVLESRGHRATIYHAGLGPDVRRDNLRMFRRGMFDVLVCCRALDEGMNVPEASVAIVASSTSSRRQRIQRLGRVLRRSSTKKAATIYTLFATDEEGQRLAKEAESLEGVAEVAWSRSSRVAHA